MAEKGAHLTHTVQIRPSIFDFVAQESLSDLLYPSARRIIDVLSFRNRNFQIVNKWFDESFLITHLALQFHYLSKYGGTFSESFYGLQRVALSGRASLKRKALFLSLLTVTLIPYLKMKLQKRAEKIYLDELPVETNKTRVLQLKCLLGVNSCVHICLQIINFAQHLRYLSGNSDINSPLLWLSGVKLQYVSEDVAQEQFNIRTVIPQMLRRSLEVGAFFMQFYQWWQSEQVGVLGSLPVPPPPPPVSCHTPGLCPICQQPRHMDTALSVSGFVFCFSCITEALRERSFCPVTQLPATLDHLIRLYPPDNKTV